MSGPFSLEVDPDALDSAANRLTSIAEGLQAMGAEVSDTPGGISEGQWRGDSRTVICAEMTALGAFLTDSARYVDEARHALDGLATTCREALDSVTALNTRWQAAEDVHTAEISRIDRQEAAVESGLTGRTRTAALESLNAGQVRSEADAGRSLEQERARTDYDDLVEELRQAFRVASVTLAGALAVRLDPGHEIASVTGYSGPMLPSTVEEALARKGMVLAADRQDMLAGERAAALFNAGLWVTDTDQLESAAEAFAGTLDVDSVAFQQGFLSELDPRALLAWQAKSESLVTAEQGQAMADVTAVIAQVMARGSDPDLHGGHDTPDSFDDFYDRWRDVYRAESRDHGYGLLAQIVLAGQGEEATWDSDLLIDITTEIIDHDRKQDWYAAGTGALGVGDPLAAMLMATSRDEEASLRLLVGDPEETPVDTSRLDYLFVRDWRVPFLPSGTATDPGYGEALGSVLSSAAQPVGEGDEGTPEHASAVILSRIVTHFGSEDHTLIPGMEKPVVDILCHHIDDVIKTFDAGVPGFNTSNSRTPRLLPEAALGDVLTEVFATDVRRLDQGYSSGELLLVQQFTGTATLALKQEFLAAAESQGNGTSAMMTYGYAMGMTQKWMGDAFSEDASDKAAADARARAVVTWAINLVASYALSSNVESTGLSTLLGSVKGDAAGALGEVLIPLEDYESEADGAAGSAFDDLNHAAALSRWEWLAEAGLVPVPDGSTPVDRWQELRKMDTHEVLDLWKDEEALSSYDGSYRTGMNTARPPVPEAG